MSERAEERDAEIDELRARIRELENQVHEYRTRVRITALAPYDGKSPEAVLRGFLQGNTTDQP